MTGWRRLLFRLSAAKKIRAGPTPCCLNDKKVIFISSSPFGRRGIIKILNKLIECGAFEPALDSTSTHTRERFCNKLSAHTNKCLKNNFCVLPLLKRMRRLQIYGLLDSGVSHLLTFSLMKFRHSWCERQLFARKRNCESACEQRTFLSGSRSRTVPKLQICRMPFSIYFRYFIVFGKLFHMAWKRTRKLSSEQILRIDLQLSM